MSKIKLNKSGYPVVVLENGNEWMRGEDCQHQGLHGIGLVRMSAPTPSEGDNFTKERGEAAAALNDWYSRK